MKWTGFGNVGTIIEEEGYDCFWVASMNLVVRVDNKLLKTSFIFSFPDFFLRIVIKEGLNM